VREVASDDRGCRSRGAHTPQRLAARRSPRAVGAAWISAGRNLRASSTGAAIALRLRGLDRSLP
jgi:hypothetical protein